MKKTLLVSAITLSLWGATSAQAQTITITGLDFLGSTSATGAFNSNGNGIATSTTPLFSEHWTASQQSWYDTHTGVLTWAGTGTISNPNNAFDDFSYTFSLTGNQVAAGIFWDWTGNNNIPILTIFDCPVSGGGVCTSTSLPAQTQPIMSSILSFNGTTVDDFPVSSNVPVPAAVWLMGSGLLGLVGMARRKKT